MKNKNKIYKKEIENEINSIFTSYDLIRWYVDKITTDELPVLKGANDSFKLGYLISTIKQITADIEADVEVFNSNYSDEFLIEY